MQGGPPLEVRHNRGGRPDVNQDVPGTVRSDLSDAVEGCWGSRIGTSHVLDDGVVPAPHLLGIRVRVGRYAPGKKMSSDFFQR